MRCLPRSVIQAASIAHAPSSCSTPHLFVGRQAITWGVNPLGGASAQLFGIQLEVETWRRPDSAEVIDLATLPEAHPVGIVFALRIPASTDLRINTQVDGGIDQISELGPCGVNALDDDQVRRRDGLRRSKPPIVGFPIVRLEGG